MDPQLYPDFNQQQQQQQQPQQWQQQQFQPNNSNNNNYYVATNASQQQQQQQPQPFIAYNGPLHHVPHPQYAHHHHHHHQQQQHQRQAPPPRPLYREDSSSTNVGKFSFKDLFLTVSGSHLFLGVCFRKKSHKKHYTTLRRIIFLLYCMLCSLFFVLFMQQIKYYSAVVCQGSTPIYNDCLGDFGRDYAHCPSVRTYITPESGKAIRRSVYSFVYEYDDAYNSTISKWSDSKFCVPYCIPNIIYMDTRPPCYNVTQEMQKSLICTHPSHYCNTYTSPLVGAIVSGILAVIFFYPSKLLLSCALKVTGPGKLCNNILGRIWLCVVGMMLAVVILFWVSYDMALLRENRLLFKSAAQEIFVYGLVPFAISIFTGFSIDLVVSTIMYFVLRKWRHNKGDEEDEERVSLLAPPPATPTPTTMIPNPNPMMIPPQQYHQQ